MSWSSQRAFGGGGVHRPTRLVTAVALGLILFSVGVRAFRARPFPVEARAGMTVAGASKAHSKCCGLSVVSMPQMVLDPRTPSLAPPVGREGTPIGYLLAFAAGSPTGGRSTRAPPAV
jgi:hypothetical protein